MNISKHSFITRLLCCLLVCLFLCCTVMRPVSASAVATGATAGLAYVTVEAAIPWLLSALSVGYLASYGSELFYSVKDAICNWAVTSSLGQALKAYSYGSDYCLDSDVLEAAADAVNGYLSGDFMDICQKGSAFSNAYIIEIDVGAGGNEKHYFWGNAAPRYNQNGNDLTLILTKPSILFTGMTDDYNDYSQSNVGTYSFSFLNSSLVDVTAVSPDSLLKTDVSDVAEQLATTGIWVVDATGGDNDNGKQHYLPVIPTKDIDSSDVETTSTQVEVETSSSNSSVDLSGILGWLYKIWKAITEIPDFITEFEASIGVSTIPPLLQKLVEWTQNLPEIFADHWADFKEKMLEIPDILREIREFVKNLPETLTQIWEWLKTLPSVIYNSIVNALEYLFVPSDGYLDWRVDNLRTSFSLFDSIIGSAGILRNFFNFATTPPIIYIDLGASTSWAMGGRTVFIDMSWYAQYKPTMDLVISVFLWLLFLWRIFLALPGIISGTSGSWGSGSVESTKTSGCTDISIIR